MVELTYSELAQLLKKAYRAQHDRYAEVSVHCYCGGMFDTEISCSGLDEGSDVGYYISFVYEGTGIEDDGSDVTFYVGRLIDGVKEHFTDYSDVHEMDKTTVQVAESEIQKLNDLSNGQGFLF